MHLSHIGTVLNFRRDRNEAVAFITIQEQPFSLLRYCGMVNIPSVASEAQTNGRLTGQDQEYKIIRLQDYRTIVSD
jgi:hypothetical protein